MGKQIGVSTVSFSVTPTAVLGLIPDMREHH